MGTNFEWQKQQVDERIRDRLQESARSRKVKASRPGRRGAAAVLRSVIAAAVFCALLAVFLFWVY